MRSVLHYYFSVILIAIEAIIFLTSTECDWYHFVCFNGIDRWRLFLIQGSGVYAFFASFYQQHVWLFRNRLNSQVEQTRLIDADALPARRTNRNL